MTGVCVERERIEREGKREREREARSPSTHIMLVLFVLSPPHTHFFEPPTHTLL